MAVITPFFDVVAGVAILAGRSSLLDTGVFKTANTNFTIRHILALGFIGVGVWNLWKIERAQDKLKKSLGAESDRIDLLGAEIWAEAELYEADDEVYSVSIGYVGLGKDDGEQFAEKLFTLKESVVDRLEDEWKGVYYFDINDDSQKKPMSYKQITDILERGSFNAESFGAEPMFVESDSLMVELMGFDGSYRTDGEVKMGYTTAAELGFEPKELKPVMWVWDDIEGYGAFMPTEKIRFI